MLNPFAAARFTISCAELSQLPSAELPEIAFAGRSNAGKSSALNTLCGHKQLARVSKTPGRTQLINYFELPGRGRLVDLPGYGFAKVPLEIRRSWKQLIGGYLDGRENLRGVVVIMDIRHPMTDLDQQMLGWARAAGRDSHILLTKADKLGYGASKDQLVKVKAELKRLGQDSSVQLYSAHSGLGVEDARTFLEAWLLPI
jgi:GTP-binding protein